MKLSRRILACVLICALSVSLFCSCSYVDSLTDAYTQMFQSADKQSAAEESAYEVTSEGEDEFESLVALFAEKGYSAEWSDADPIFLSGARRTIILNDGEYSVNAFIYPSAEDAAEEASYFSADGSKYDSAEVGIDISWAADPHLYLCGSMIVLYVGSDSGFISHLTDMLGKQFAGTDA